MNKLSVDIVPSLPSVASDPQILYRYRGDGSMTFQDCISILRSRWRTVLYTLATVVAIAVLLSFVIPAHYKAAASVVVDVKSANPLADTTLPSQLITNYIQTQIDIITSDRVAQDVVQRLHLDRKPEIVEDWHDSYYFQPTNFVPWTVDWLHKKLSVKPPLASNVITINFTSKDPRFAADVANAFMAAYLQTTLELNVVPARNFAQWFEERIKALRGTLELAQNKLSEFQQTHGIVQIDDHIDVENARLGELTAGLAAAQGQRADSSSRQSQIRTGVEDLPEVLQNQLITALKTDIVRDQAELDQMADRLGTNHPQYLSLKTQLASLQARESAEVNRIASSLTATDRVGHLRVTDMEQAVATQKARVLQLRAERDRAAVLQRDVETAQRAYDLAAQRLAQSSLEGQMQQTNVAVLTSAVPPIKPAWPKLLIDVAVAVFLGCVLGFGNALLQESLNPRIRNTIQLAELEDVPVLSVIGSRSTSKLRDRPTLWVRSSGRARRWLTVR